MWGSLGLIVAAHTSLGCGPLHLAGTDEQKQRFLVPMAQRRGPRRVRPDRARRRLATPAARGRPPRARATARRRHVGPRRRASGSSRTPARPAPTSSPPGPATTRRRATPRSARSSSRPTRPGSASAGSRTSSGCTPRRPASCCFERRAGPGREPARRAGRRLPDVPQDPRRRADLDRGAGGRAWPRRRSTRASRTPRRASSSAGRSASFQGVAFMIADMATEIEAARPARLEAAWLKDQGRDYGLVGGRGQAVRVRGQLAGDERGHPDPRRLRLRDRLPGRALHARREADRDRGGDQPGPAPGDRPEGSSACGSSERAGRSSPTLVEADDEPVLAPGADAGLERQARARLAGVGPRALVGRGDLPPATRRRC